MCHVAGCEHKLSAKSWSRQCTINKVIVYQKIESARNRLNESSGIVILIKLFEVMSPHVYFANNLQSHLIITTNLLTLDTTEKNVPLQSFLRNSLLLISHFNRFIISLRLELVRYNRYHLFCVLTSPQGCHSVIAMGCFLYALQAVHQSQRTSHLTNHSSEGSRRGV